MRENSRILCIMSLPPDPVGRGGSQRSWNLIQALLPYGEVHFVLIFCDQHLESLSTSLAPLEPFAASVTRIDIPAWRCTEGRTLGVVHPWLRDIARMRSHVAPKFRAADLRAIAARLPLADPDLIFAGRLSAAVITQDLIEAGLLASPRRVLDFDDILSRYRTRQIAAEGPQMGRQWRLCARFDRGVLARAERRVASAWDAVSVCSDEDAQALRALAPTVRVVRLPNVVRIAPLPPRAPDGRFRVLFVGNLGFTPNAHGLAAFVETAWADVVRAVPETELVVVGLNPPAAIVALAERHGLVLHANVPSVAPFYADCDMVIAPILFGSGTRVKIVEAMGYGRPVLSTTPGAEGLGLEPGRHIMLADGMGEFGRALVSLARDPAGRDRLAAQALDFQRRHFGPEAAEAGMQALLAPGTEGHPAPAGRAGQAGGRLPA